MPPLQVIRPSRQECVIAGEAHQLIGSWHRFTVQAITLEVIDRTLDLHNYFSLSYWDEVILIAAQIASWEPWLSEDMAGGMTYGSVLVRNPFAGL
jgi:predicted nucleic acid-binding protein